MIPWYAPSTIKDNLRRLMALRSAMVLTAILALAVTEFRFDWIESAVGAYLVSTNAQRPQSGTVWDQGHQTDKARQTLTQYMNQRTGTQREVRRATSMGQVVAGIDAEQGAMISSEHFVELYQKLPPVLSHEIISPYTLLIHMSGNRWRRTFFERQGEQLNIYLLDAHNQVLHRLVVGSVLMEHIQRGEVAIQSRLDQLGDFAHRIFPAEQFFTALNTLPEEVKKGILGSPADLLHLSGRITRVGISSQTLSGAVDIGFEVEEVQGAKVILTQGRASDVARLLWLLEEQSSSFLMDEEEELP
ncbi:MAG: hypothetical protein PVH87_08510 [Desulfobacteraceae bacterium]|jgi:hypothetical protein